MPSRAGRWTSRRTPSALDRHRPGPPGSWRGCRPPAPKYGRSTLVTLASSSERSRLRWNLSRRTRSFRTAPPVPPLLALPARCPFAVLLLRPLPVIAPPKRRAHLRIGVSTPRHPVPSSWSLTTSTDCSAAGPRVCCTPLTALGFVAFDRPGSEHQPERGRAASPPGTGTHARFPATRSTPFEGFPSSAAVPHRCGPCPPAVAAPRARRLAPRGSRPHPKVEVKGSVMPIRCSDPPEGGPPHRSVLHVGSGRIPISRRAPPGRSARSTTTPLPGTPGPGRAPGAASSRALLH